jgi:NADH-quinone oxidoreductase subunit H
MNAITSFFTTPHLGNPWLVALATAIKGAVIMGIIFQAAGYIVLWERKVIAWLQHRVGPNRAGPFGIFQPIADVLKLLTKEDSLPPFVDKVLFIAAPLIITITGLLGLGLIPWGNTVRSAWFAVTDTNVGILLFLAFSSLGVYSIVLAGWSSNSKYAMIGGLRATAQMISYELSMSMSVLAVVMLVGSMNLNHIVLAQTPVWFIVLQPIGFIVFLISIVAESRRTPFDLPEAENELVAGFHTEYSSMKFALFFLGEYIGVIMLSSVLAILYLGGWRGPWVETYPILGPVYLLLKIFVLMFFFIWIRATYPRYRYDHLMNLGWKYLIPLSLLNLVLTAILVLALPELVPAVVVR